MDRVALVTGASRGIGASCAKKLIELGYKVVGTATSEVGLSQIHKNIPNITDAIKLNLLDRENVLEINKILPTISVLVNNAGITQDNLFIRMQEQEIDDVMSVNLTNTLLLTKQCIRGMLRAKFGRIINITSIVGHSGNIGQANYAASKAGMTAFTKSIALEYGSKNITANCIAPGFIETDMSLDIAADKREKILHSIPLGRFGAPEDVANAVKFLSSEAANYITGSTIHVNGGMSML